MTIRLIYRQGVSRMRIAICDDEEIYRTLILRMLEEYAATHKSMNLSFSAFSQPKDLLDATATIGDFDIYILDIVMPAMNGIDLGVRLRQNGYTGIIIYLTGSMDHAIDSYKAKASNYILKPFKKEIFMAAIEEALAITNDKANNSILVKTKENSILLSFDRILYVDMTKRILRFHLTNGITIESITIRVPFADAVSELLADKRFYQVGKTLVINLQNVTKVGSEDVVFKDKTPIYFSKNICRDLRTQWGIYWLNTEHKEQE